ncbi:hypothetical protein [Amphibacillus indicireducens]|uniref:Uncharacterized protein n=1 Tax=Amphibacillus indicireducens TaxID=1076330 RepID=A0ABP7VMR6_9BACI
MKENHSYLTYYSANIYINCLSININDYQHCYPHNQAIFYSYPRLYPHYPQNNYTSYPQLDH